MFDLLPTPYADALVSGLALALVVGAIALVGAVVGIVTRGLGYANEDDRNSLTIYYPATGRHAATLSPVPEGLAEPTGAPHPVAAPSGRRAAR
jgi:hypothetical protein